MNVLIVEDNATVANVARIIIQSATPQVDVDIAENAENARQKIHAKAYDFIFMDFGLPGESGLELTAALREMGIDIPIVGLTANKDSYTDEEIEAVGLNDCLLKPLTQALWCQVIRNYRLS